MNRIRRVLTAAMGVAMLASLMAGCDSAEERALKHQERGFALLEAGDKTRAGLEFRNAIKLDENLIPSYLELADLLLSEGNLRGAIANHLRVLELDPNQLRALKSLGRIMLAAGQLDTALRHSATAVRLAPEDPEALALRAAVALRLGEPHIARSLSDKALAADPANIDTRLVRAAIELQAERPGAALTELDAALEADERNVSVNVMRIVALERLGAMAEIGEVLRRLVGFYPEDRSLRLVYANWLLETGKPDEAVTIMRVMTDQAPEDAALALNVVRFIARAQGNAAASAELSALIAAEADPGDRLTFQTELAKYRALTGDRVSAIAMLRGAIDSARDVPESEGARVALAQLLLTDGDYAAAWQLTESVIERDPLDPAALTLRGRLLMGEGRHGEAIRDLRAALGRAPDDPGVLLLLAEAHERSGNRQLAGERLGAAAEASGFAAIPSLGYARYLASEGRIDFADTVIQNALAAHPRDGRLLRALAEIQLQRHDWVGAEQTARELEIIEHDLPGESSEQLAARIHAAAMRGRSQFDESLRILRHAYSADGWSGSGMAALVETYLLAGQPEPAAEFLVQVLAENPKNVQALILQGALRQSQGDTEGVEAAYRAAIAAQPRSDRGYLHLSRLMMERGDVEKAEAVLRDGLGAVAEDDELRMALSLALEARGNSEAAIAELEKLREAWPDSIIIANNLASLIAENREDPESVERAFALARRLADSPIPEFRDTYGWILHLRGDHIAAIAQLEPAAAALPGNPLVQYHLGMAYAAAELNTEAVAQLTVALGLLGDTPTPQRQEAERERNRMQSIGAAR